MTLSSLIDPNPAFWADGTERSQNNGFTHGFGERIDLHAMQVSENRRRGSSNGIDTRRERGPQSGSKAQQLRDALAAGPMTSRELAAVTGIHMDHVPSLLQWSVSIGQIKQLRETKPIRYALPSAAAIVKEGV